MKPLRPIIAFLFTGLILVPGSAAQVQEQDYPEPGAFKIDWERQVVIVHSLGAPNTNLPRPAWRSSALRAARLSAERDLLEAVKGVAISSTTTVENAMVTSDIIKSKVDGVVKDFIVLDTKYFEAMDVGLVVEMPLTGALYDAVLPGNTGGMVGGGEQPGYQPQPRVSGPVTGLVVDARGLDVTPAMAPKILDERGDEVYGTTKLLRQWAMTIGVVGYHNNVQGAQQDERVAGNPMVVRAQRATGPNSCDLIISLDDANRVRQAAESGPFLEECRVMIVLGPAD